MSWVEKAHPRGAVGPEFFPGSLAQGWVARCLTRPGPALPLRNPGNLLSLSAPHIYFTLLWRELEELDA